MKVVTLSDTHGKHDGIDVPDGDVLIRAGDFMNGGTNPRELFTFNQWFAAQPHRHKILVDGNPDRLFETIPELSRSWLHPSIVCLEDQGCEIDGVRFWGAPWQPPFHELGFQPGPPSDQETMGADPT